MGAHDFMSHYKGLKHPSVTLRHIKRQSPKEYDGTLLVHMKISDIPPRDQLYGAADVGMRSKVCQKGGLQMDASAFTLPAVSAFGIPYLNMFCFQEVP